MTEPLIYTSLGNVPVSGLEYRPSWEFRTDPSDASIPLTMAFIEEYRHEGAIVKRSVHVYDFQGTAAAGAVADLA